MATGGRQARLALLRNTGKLSAVQSAVQESLPTPKPPVPLPAGKATPRVPPKSAGDLLDDYLSPSNNITQRRSHKENVSPKRKLDALLATAETSSLSTGELTQPSTEQSARATEAPTLAPTLAPALSQNTTAPSTAHAAGEPEPVPSAPSGAAQTSECATVDAPSASSGTAPIEATQPAQPALESVPTAVSVAEAPPIKPPRRKRQAPSQQSLELESLPSKPSESSLSAPGAAAAMSVSLTALPTSQSECAEASAALMSTPKRTRCEDARGAEDSRPRASTVGSVARPKSAIVPATWCATPLPSAGPPPAGVTSPRPLSVWMRDVRKRTGPEEIERQSKMIDGIEKMMKALTEEDEERLTQLNFELTTARATLRALQETRPPPALVGRSRTLCIDQISIPIHWWASIVNRERVSFHCFLVVQADNQVRHTSLKVLHGTDSIDELIFDDAMEFEGIPSGTCLSIKMYTHKTTRRDALNTTTTPRKKAIEFAQSMASRLQSTPRKLMERLTGHHERDASETPRRAAAARGPGEFALVAQVTLGPHVLAGRPRVIELAPEGIEPVPFGSTLCLSMSLARCESDSVHYEGSLTFYEQPSADVAGSWVRRRAVLAGNLLHCHVTSDNGRDEAIHQTIDLEQFVGAIVQKVPRSECARMNSLALMTPGPAGEMNAILKMAADTRESREEWLSILTHSLNDISAWSSGSH